MDSMYPLYAALTACVLAQAIKPLLQLLFFREWDWKMAFSTGGLPSSHSALVSSLALATGIVEKFSSTLFAVTLVIAMIVCYDAANVRRYAGNNIAITQQLVDDLKELAMIHADNPVYQVKLKKVLGHTYFEVGAGIIFGLLVSCLMYLLVM